MRLYGDHLIYTRNVKNKPISKRNISAPFYECAVHLGALFGKATRKTIKGIERFGRLYGEMIQIHDDLNDVMAVPANPDWLQYRKPLPILFAHLVAHPDQARFIELYQDMSRDGALQEAQEILIRSGEVSYCVDQLIRRHQTAQGILNEIPLQNKETVDSLIEAVIAPVRRLFETLEIPPGAVPTFAEVVNRER